MGLDPDLTRIPAHLLNSKHPIFDFNKAIVDATADLVCAFKPQVAYYSAQSAESDLEMTVEYIRHTYPQLVIILDAKRSGFGNTSTMYAVTARYSAADLVTKRDEVRDKTEIALKELVSSSLIEKGLDGTTIKIGNIAITS